VALKQIRILPQERQNGIPITAIREIAILQSLKHVNIVNVLDVAVGQESETDSDGDSAELKCRTEEQRLDKVYMVMEYAEQVGDPPPAVQRGDITLFWALDTSRWLIFPLP
jgi:cyclin-dependent kinase 10